MAAPAVRIYYIGGIIALVEVFADGEWQKAEVQHIEGKTQWKDALKRLKGLRTNGDA